MSARNQVPDHFGPPRELTEVRLFGRWTLWTRYRWSRGKTIDEVLEGVTKPIEGAMEALGGMFGHKHTLKLDENPVDPFDEKGDVKP